MKWRSLILVFFMTVLIIPLNTSCKKVGSKVVKSVLSKKGVKSAVSIGGATLLMIGIEELMAGDMIDLFEEGSGSQGGTTTIYNINAEDVRFEMSVDGLKWFENSISGEESLEAAAGPKGYIAIHTGDGGYFMLVPGKEYAISEENGKITVAEVEEIKEG